MGSGLALIVRVASLSWVVILTFVVAVVVNRGLVCEVLHSLAMGLESLVCSLGVIAEEGCSNDLGCKVHGEDSFSVY